MAKDIYVEVAGKQHVLLDDEHYHCEDARFEDCPVEISPAMTAKATGEADVTAIKTTAETDVASIKTDAAQVQAAVEKAV